MLMVQWLVSAPITCVCSKYYIHVYFNKQVFNTEHCYDIMSVVAVSAYVTSDNLFYFYNNLHLRACSQTTVVQIYSVTYLSIL